MIALLLRLGACAAGGAVAWRAVPAAAEALAKRACARAGGGGADGLLADGFPLERFLALRRWRPACALLMAAWCLLLTTLPLAPLPAAALCVCGFALAVAVLCDLSDKLIPWESCALLAASGALAQIASGGPAALASGLLFALLVLAVCVVTDALLARIHGARARAALKKEAAADSAAAELDASHEDAPRAPAPRADAPAPEAPSAIGGGDLRCMAALALASGQAAPLGLALSCLLAAAFGLVALVAGRLGLRQGMPFAPFFLPWILCAALCCAGLI